MHATLFATDIVDGQNKRGWNCKFRRSGDQAEVEAILDCRDLHFFLRVLGSLMCDCACIPSLMRRLVPRLKLFSLQPDPRAGMSARTFAN